MKIGTFWVRHAFHVYVRVSKSANGKKQVLSIRLMLISNDCNLLWLLLVQVRQVYAVFMVHPSSTGELSSDTDRKAPARSVTTAC